MDNPETLTFKLLGVVELTASGSFAIVLATLLAAAVIVRFYKS